jgi:hypothetical protein
VRPVMRNAPYFDAIVGAARPRKSVAGTMSAALRHIYSNGFAAITAVTLAFAIWLSINAW